MNKEARVGLFILVAIIILFYLSINIGALRLFSNSYFVYKTYFDDVVGLEVKSAVKISGITVGWVEAVNLTDKGKAEVVIRVNRAHKLFKNSYATITQDSLLGNKVLEVDSGESSSGMLPPGSTLHMPGRSSASLGDILEGVKDITNSVQEVSHTFNRVFSSTTGEERMKKSLEDVSTASERLSKFSTRLDNVMKDNEDHLSSVAKNLDVGVCEFSKAMPDLKAGVNEFREHADHVMVDAKVSARNTARATQSARIVSEKIERGEGTIGKFINEDEVYDGVKDTVDGLKSFVGKAKNLEVHVDAHNEQFRRLDNARGELNIILKFRDDYFYIIQLASDERGKFSHNTVHTSYFREDGVTPIDRFSDFVGINDPNASLSMSGFGKTRTAPITKKTTLDRTSVRKGFQVAKKFDRTIFRAGLFEDTFGVAVDFDVPLRTDKMRWVTTLEAFDFSGFNRVSDDRAHVRWSNRAFIFKNIYTYFGFDDIFSRRDAAPFWGAGIAFNDDDMKFLLYSMMGKSTGD